jgi:hypothetical protein
MSPGYHIHDWAVIGIANANAHISEKFLFIIMLLSFSEFDFINIGHPHRRAGQFYAVVALTECYT